MLVLSRKKGEAIVINGNVRVVIVEQRGDKTRVGIQAPQDVVVHREEVWLAIQRENRRIADEREREAMNGGPVDGD